MWRRCLPYGTPCGTADGTPGGTPDWTIGRATSETASCGFRWELTIVATLPSSQRPLGFWGLWLLNWLCNHRPLSDDSLRAIVLLPRTGLPRRLNRDSLRWTDRPKLRKKEREQLTARTFELPVFPRWRSGVTPNGGGQ